MSANTDGMMVVNSKLLEELESSTCFGVAYNGDTKECKQCDVQQECSARSAGNRAFDSVKTLSPKTTEALTSEPAPTGDTSSPEAVNDTTPPKPAEDDQKVQKPRTHKPKHERPAGMPDPKTMTNDQLVALLKERGGSCKVYDKPNIYHMRLVMAIEKTYK
jgi:hypothetical protein